jgi:hypothetical protein
MEPDHPEPFNEGTQRALERLMALGVLVEAGARLAAENTRNKANRAEQQAEQRARDSAARERDEQKAARMARAEASRRERDWARFAADGGQVRDYLAGLPFQEVARHWGQAARHADTNPTAATVLAAAEDDLYGRAPGLMDQYRQQRDAGLSRHEAMACAVRHNWSGAAPARPHGGPPAAAGSLTQIGEELDREIARLAGRLDPVGKERLLRNLEDGGWSAESLAYVEALMDRAATRRRSSTIQAGTPDDKATAVNEHQAAASGATAEASRAGADDSTATATTAAATRGPGEPAQVAAQSFPVPAQLALAAHPATQSARGPAARTTARRTR